MKHVMQSASVLAEIHIKGATLHYHRLRVRAATTAWKLNLKNGDRGIGEK
jgi:hypothetical protein